MPKEFQEYGPNLRRSASEILLRQRVEQLCMRLIVEPIFSRPRYFTGVKIVVGSVLKVLSMRQAALVAAELITAVRVQGATGSVLGRQ